MSTPSDPRDEPDRDRPVPDPGGSGGSGESGEARSPGGGLTPLPTPVDSSSPTSDRVGRPPVAPAAENDLAAGELGRPTRRPTNDFQDADSTGEDDPGGWSRLHPMTPLIMFVRRLLGFALPILAIFVIRPQSTWIIFFVLSAAVGTIAGLLHYLHFRYRLDHDEIVVRQGIFRRTVRNVPYTKIQNLDLTRDLLDRTFGLSKLSLETASGTEPEAVFQWIRPEQVEEIRERVLAARKAAKPTRVETEDAAVVSAHPDSPPELGAPPRSATEGALPVGEPVDDVAPGSVEVVHEVPLKDLLLLGLFSLRGLALFGLALGLAFEFDLFITDVEDARNLFEFLTGLGGSPALTYGGAILALLFVVTLASIVLTVVEFYGFKLSSAGAELRNRYGLFTQRTGTIPRGRIQILEVQSPLHLRRFRRLRLRAGTAGGSSEGGAGRTWLVPVFEESDLAPILAEVQPETPIEGRDWLPVHPRTTARLRRRAVYWSLIATGLAFLVWGPWGIAALVLLPLGWFYAKRVAEHLAYSQSDEAIYARRGWLRRVTQVVKLNRIQAAEVIERPFDRRWGMATLRIDTASPNAGRLEVPYLPQEEALRLQQELIREANRRRFRW